MITIQNISERFNVLNNEKADQIIRDYRLPKDHKTRMEVLQLIADNAKDKMLEEQTPASTLLFVCAVLTVNQTNASYWNLKMDRGEVDVQSAYSIVFNYLAASGII